MTLSMAGRYLPASVGLAPAAYEQPRPQHAMFTALVSRLWVRLNSSTNTQGMPSYRPSILPSQSSSTAGSRLHHDAV